jgi:cytochrome c553
MRPIRNTCTGFFSRAIALVLVTFACAPVWAQATSKPDAAARGAVQGKPCTQCHGTSEQPALPGVPSLAGQQAEFLEAQLFFIREGLRPVPQMEGMLKGMKDSDLSDMAAYFSKQAPLRLRTKPNPELQARGEAVAKQHGCGTCHMPDFAGQRQIPRINGQSEEYLAATLKAYKDNKRTGSDTSMNALMYGISESDMKALAHYLAHRS